MISTDLLFIEPFGFKIMFKCMTGYTTANGKFLKSLSEKITYSKSGGRCERLGLQVQLPKSHEEQIFIDTIPSYSSNWLRIQFDTNQIISDDEFRGEILTSLSMASSRQSSLVTLKLKW